jgi:hypothetical protein
MAGGALGGGEWRTGVGRVVAGGEGSVLPSGQARQKQAGDLGAGGFGLGMRRCRLHALRQRCRRTMGRACRWRHCRLHSAGRRPATGLGRARRRLLSLTSACARAVGDGLQSAILAGRCAAGAARQIPSMGERMLENRTLGSSQGARSKAPHAALLQLAHAQLRESLLSWRPRWSRQSTACFPSPSESPRLHAPQTASSTVTAWQDPLVSCQEPIDPAAQGFSDHTQTLRDLVCSDDDTWARVFPAVERTPHRRHSTSRHDWKEASVRTPRRS